MAHLSTQLQQRFLARLLSPEETLDVIEHVRGCAACRESLLALRSAKSGSLAEAVLPETLPADGHPPADALAAYVDDDVKPADRAQLESHLANCDVCREIITDLRTFQAELQHSSRQDYGPARIAPRSSPSLGPGFAWDSFFRWFNQPIVLASLASATALLIVVGIVAVRFPASVGIGSAESGPRVTVSDGGRRTVLATDGIVNPSAALPKEELAALNNLTGPIWRDQHLVLSVSVQETLTGLKREPSVLLGQSSTTVMFQVISPVRTLVQSVRPIFKWTTASGAANYTVHVIADDRTQEEVVTSPEVSPSTADAKDCEWTSSTSLTPGKRYRWYVTAVVKNQEIDQEIDAPGMEQPQAEFAELTETESNQLNALKQPNHGDHLIDGLLNLKAGLLDDAQSDFESLLADPGQTSSAKDFLNRMIAEIKRLKEA